MEIILMMTCDDEVILMLKPVSIVILVMVCVCIIIDYSIVYSVLLFVTDEMKQSIISIVKLFSGSVSSVFSVRNSGQ